MRYEFDQLKRTLAESRAEKNVHLVLHGALLCRLFTGAHATCCKSGKDRTSMGVTLEETRMLCDELRVVGGRKACKNSVDSQRFLVPLSFLTGLAYISCHQGDFCHQGGRLGIG